MPERSPLKEFRHLEEKLATVGLSPAEQARYRQLKEMVSPEAAKPRPGFDVNAAAEALKASLEPSGLRRPGGARDLPPPAPGRAASAADAVAPGSGRADEPWDPRQARQSGAPAGLDPGSGALNQGPVEDGSGPAWEPGAPGSYDQAAWDAGAPPPIDPAAAFDLSAPSFDAPGPEAAQPGGWDAGVAAGSEPAVRSYDLGPAAFDAAALPPPEPGPGEYDQGRWDAAPGEVPAEPGAEPPPDLGAEPPPDLGAEPPPELGAEPPPEPAAEPAPGNEPVEAEFADAELIEAQPAPEAPAPGSDFFTPGPLTPDFTGAQPLDAGRFDGEEPGLSGPPADAGWREEAAAGGPEEIFAGTGFEPAEAGGPGAVEMGEPPAAIEIAAAEAESAASEEVPLASPSEFLSSLGPAAEPAPSSVDALDAGEAPTEDLPPFEMQVEEVVEAPEPPEPIAEPPRPAVPAPAAAPRTGAPPGARPPVAPRVTSAPAAPAGPLPSRAGAPGTPPRVLDHGGPSASFVAGEHRVVVHTLEGQVLRGTIADVDLDAAAIPLVRAPGAAPESVAAARVKAIFFMLLPGGRPPAPEGRRVRVTFRDGRQVAGFSPDYDPAAAGFFMVPAESRTNTGRIWVYRAAVRQVAVS